MAQVVAYAQEATTYKYDALGRLVEVKVSGGPNDRAETTYTFDKAGNRTTLTRTMPPRVIVTPLGGLRPIVIMR